MPSAHVNAARLRGPIDSEQLRTYVELLEPINALADGAPEAGLQDLLENLALVCSWHHRPVHEDVWSMQRRRDGVVRWYRPTGHRTAREGPLLVERSA